MKGKQRLTRKARISGDMRYVDEMRLLRFDELYSDSPI
jgi:hypothetical protein